MVDWLAGKRMKGTSSERTSLSTTALGGTGVGGWVELARTTLGSAGDTITVSSLPDKRYYMVLSYQISSGQIASVGRFNNDTGSNYFARSSDNGSSDWTGSGRTDFLGFRELSGVTNPYFHVGYFANYASKEKLTQTWGVNQNTAGAGNAPTRHVSVGKWTNTSNAINRLDLVNLGSGDLNTGSEVVVLGYDPADTHTNNFWQELADVSWSSGGTIDTSTFTAKKYLWIQAWYKGSSSVTFTVNNDSGNNYAYRLSNNGAADATSTSNVGHRVNFGFDTTPVFVNCFIINNASNEKLAIWHVTSQNTASASNAPNRTEWVSKWANTSNQITSFKMVASPVFTGGQIKVWGAD